MTINILVNCFYNNCLLDNKNKFYYNNLNTYPTFIFNKQKKKNLDFSKKYNVKNTILNKAIRSNKPSCITF